MTRGETEEKSFKNRTKRVWVWGDRSKGNSIERAERLRKEGKIFKIEICQFRFHLVEKKSALSCFKTKFFTDDGIY